MKARATIQRELLSVKQQLARSPGTPLDTPITAELYGAMCALSWVLASGVARPSTIPVDYVLGMVRTEEGTP